LRNNSVRQLDGRLVEYNQINSSSTQGLGKEMRQLRAHARHRRITCEQHTQVDIAERTDLSADLRPEEVHQSHLSLRAAGSFDASLETLDVDLRHQPTPLAKNGNIRSILPHTG